VLFKDVSIFSNTCTHPAQARQLIDRGIRSALWERGVATIIVPDDIQESEAQESPPRMHGSVFTSIGYSQPRILPKESDLDRAADILNKAEKVAILIGQGAAGAPDEVIEAAETLGAGVAKALLGRTALPDDLPFVTGPIGLLGSKPSNDMMMSCDCLFMIGTSFPYAEWLPKEGQATCVEIDIDGRMIGIRYPADVHLIGDAKDTLKALLPLLERKDDRSWRDEIESNVKEWWEIVEQRALQQDDGSPMNPQRVMHELSKVLPDDAIICADSGSSTNWWARQLKLRKGMKASLSGTLATMGPGTPYAIAAKFAFPERPVIAVVGDGAFQMNGMNEMLTVKKYWEEYWKSTPTLVFCVFNNQDLNQVTWEQRVLSGDPRNPATQQIPDFPYSKYAELVGLKGVYCDDADSMADAWREALAADRPCVLEVVTDREIPPLPPHITIEQAKKMMKALAGRDQDSVGMMTKAARGKLVEFKESLKR
jgi:pyruvate dehydrogenase (quinone)